MSRIDYELFSEEDFNACLSSIREKYSCTFNFIPNVSISEVHNKFPDASRSGSAFNTGVPGGFYKLINNLIDRIIDNENTYLQISYPPIDFKKQDALRNILDLYIMYNSYNKESLMPIVITRTNEWTLIHPGNTRVAMAQYKKFKDCTVDVVLIDHSTTPVKDNISFNDFPYGIMLTEWLNDEHRKIELFAPKELHLIFSYGLLKEYQIKYINDTLFLNDIKVLKLHHADKHVEFFSGVYKNLITEGCKEEDIKQRIENSLNIVNANKKT